MEDSEVLSVNSVLSGSSIMRCEVFCRVISNMYLNIEMLCRYGKRFPKRVFQIGGHEITLSVRGELGVRGGEVYYGYSVDGSEYSETGSRDRSAEGVSSLVIPEYSSYAAQLELEYTRFREVFIASGWNREVK